MTYMFLLNCALKLVDEIILYYDARSKKHQIIYFGHCRKICVMYFTQFFSILCNIITMAVSYLKQYYTCRAEIYYTNIRTLSKAQKLRKLQAVGLTGL